LVRRSTAQKKLDERAFPIRVRFAVPAGGFGNRTLDLHTWLDDQVGRGDYAVHSSAGWAVDALGVYLRDIELARAMVEAFPDFQLADGTDDPTYSSPAQTISWQGSELFGVCNLYSLSKGQAAIRELASVWRDDTGNLPPLPAIFPDQFAPVIRQTEEGRVMSMMRWGMPSPVFALKNRKTDPGVTNVRNTGSPHWRQWLGREHRCIVPFTSFSEYEKKPEGAEAVWFALDESRPLAFFAGIWTEWTSVRKLKEGETTNDLYAFLTTEANAEVGAIHPKAMPVILTTDEETETWLTGETPEAMALQRPLPDGALQIVSRGKREDGVLQ
jgi:putative SOS response-associated peptidase YedK